MYHNIYLNIALSIALIYYGIFKLKGRKNLFSRVLVLFISSLSLIIIVSKDYIGNTLIYKIITYGGVLLLFIMLTIGAWKVRKVPEKRTAVCIYFSLLGLLILLLIVVFILVQIGFYG